MSSERERREMVDLTDREILYAAFDQDAPDYEADASHDIIEEMSQTEGLDGEPLSDEEQLAQLTGDVPEGYVGDRPLQYQHELAVDQENAQLRQQLEQERAAHQETLRRFDPERAQQRDLERAEFMDDHGLVSGDDAKAHALCGAMNEIEQQRNALASDRVNASLARAHQEYGEQFMDTYTALTQMRGPMAQQVVGHILTSA